jgi:signal transduction histidine kinase/DNA-binding response OmpR family regulator
MDHESESTMRILLVEDHPDQAELTRRTLERQLRGANVTVADRGVACLSRLAGASYDLLLLDYSLPDINGLGLLKEVKARGYRLPVVMVTGQGDERIAVEAMKGGASDYLIKTGGYLTALPAMIQKVLHQAELQRNLAAAQTEVLQRNRELTDLHTLASTLSASLRLADLLPLALEMILASVEAECGGIYLVPPEGDGLILTVHRGLPTAAMGHFPARVRAGEGLIGATALNGKSIALDDPSLPPLVGLGLRWLVVVPLAAKGRQVGILFVGSTQADGSSPERQRLLELMGNQVGAALENARLYEEAQRNLASQRALVAEFKRMQLVTTQVSSNLDISTILETIVNAVGEACGTDKNSILLVDEATHELVHGTAVGLPEEYVRAVVRVPIGGPLGGCCGTAAARNEIVIIEEMREDPLWRPYLTLSEAAGLRAVWSVPLTGKDGRVLGTFATYHSTPHRPGPEQIELVQMYARQAAIAIENARLYKEVISAYEDLQQAQSRIIQTEKLRALGEMAGGVAHDFNNLLAIILGRTQYLSLRHGEMTPEEVRRSFGIIERASLDGAETVRRLMNFTRATPRSREAEAVDPNEILDYVADASRPRWKDEAEAKGRRIQVIIQRGDVPPVEGNGSELREVMLNLVFNAIEAMPQGGILTLKSWTEGGSVCLAVQDTGIGMPEEVAQKIFDPFFTTKGPQRSGLGLSVSYGIVRRHHGEILVDSQPGRGTTFTVRLPIRPTQAHPVEAVPELPHACLRILIVDDDSEVRETLRDLLLAAKHTVIEAGDGEEALEMLEREPVDLVCTDLGMPGMTGWELADRVKVRWPGLKVALITGWGAQVEPEDLEAHGVDLFIAKPFQVKEILQALDGIAAGSQMKGR